MNKFTLMFGISVVLASCAQISPLSSEHGSQASQTDYSILNDARPVPLLVGQAIAFDRHLTSAGSEPERNQQTVAEQTLTKAASLSVSTIKVNDLLGTPFIHLTFITDFPIEDPLTYGLRLSEREANSTNPNTQSINVGASTIRVPISSVTNNQTVLRNVALTVKALGGKNKLKEWVSFNGNDLYARDIQGQLWDVTHQRPLSKIDAADLLEKYTALVKRNQKDVRMMGDLNEAWNEYLSAAKQTQQQGLTANLTSYANPDGTLNIQRAGLDYQAKIQAKNITGQTLTPYTNCWWAYFFTKCATRDAGTFTPDNVDRNMINNSPFLTAPFTTPYSLIAGGFAQRSSQVGHTGDVFRAPDVITKAFVNVDLIGCGPATAQSVLFWYWKRGNTFLKNTTYKAPGSTVSTNFDSIQNKDIPIYNAQSFSSDGKILQNTYSVNISNIVHWLNIPDANGYPYMTKLMKSQFLGTNGQNVVTDPYGFRTGLQAFLNSQSSQGNSNPATVRSGYASATESVYENNNYSDTIRSILHDKFLANEPVVAVYTIPSGYYGVTPGSAHFSPVISFRVQETTTWVDTFVRTVDHHGIDMNLNTPWDYVRGVFGIYGLKNIQ